MAAVGKFFLKLLPGVLLGEWAALLAVLFVGQLFSDAFAHFELVAALGFAAFVAVAVTAGTPGRAWGRCLVGAAVLCFLTPLPSTKLAQELERGAAAADPTVPPEALGFAAAVLGGTGTAFSFLFWGFLGLCLLLPGVALLRARPRRDVEAANRRLADL